MLHGVLIDGIDHAQRLSAFPLNASMDGEEASGVKPFLVTDFISSHQTLSTGAQRTRRWDQPRKAPHCPTSTMSRRMEKRTNGDAFACDEKPSLVTGFIFFASNSPTAAQRTRRWDHPRNAPHALPSSMPQRMEKRTRHDALACDAAHVILPSSCDRRTP
jgi:hypothetical protein